MQIEAGLHPGDEGKTSPKHVRDIDRRPWTAVEKHKLRGLVSRQVSAAKIAKQLRRPLASIRIMATSLGLTIEQG
ncbi:hypothetical protein V1283_006429 [Bradyrhizobium sp. AZCC 2262]|uniref:hypothetical protein n=1 Tax=Bradyrhizobium sp. AZCC 2262 TaxID=3117022 RepID=UPI002FF39E2F